MPVQFVCGTLLTEDKLHKHFHRANIQHEISCRQFCSAVGKNVNSGNLWTAWLKDYVFWHMFRQKRNSKVVRTYTLSFSSAGYLFYKKKPFSCPNLRFAQLICFHHMIHSCMESFCYIPQAVAGLYNISHNPRKSLKFF